MATLLLELFSEEIPARMQQRAEDDLVEALAGRLKAANLHFEGAFGESGPRRLTVVVSGLQSHSANVREERKGPKVGAPDKAIEGFLRGAGLKDISEAQVVSDPKKGDYYVAVIETPGRDAADVVAEAVPAIIREFHWPKSMRWASGDLRWVRPLQRITCLLDGKIVPFDVDGIASSNMVEGHRVHGRGPYEVTGWEDYRKTLEGKGHVKLSRRDRREVILKGIKDVCAKAGLEWVEDQGLLDEVTGLAEWPVVVLGDMDPAFLDLPPEVITLSMRTHQKYFAVNDKKTGKLAPHFIVVANIEASDGGKKIAEGNARVLSARLEDARFFYENDKATPLEEMAKKLSTIAFKAELGSLGDKVERVAALAEELAEKVGADPKLARRAAELAKADLVSEMVGEFPELQGVMGRYYALEAGEPAAVADAIRDHYKPQGPSDSVPTDPVGIAVPLADKLDTLVGFWAIDEKPTGSKDPFALRRAALGVVRIILEQRLKLSLDELIEFAFRELRLNRLISTLVLTEYSRSDSFEGAVKVLNRSKTLTELRGDEVIEEVIEILRLEVQRDADIKAKIDNSGVLTLDLSRLEIITTGENAGSKEKRYLLQGNDKHAFLLQFPDDLLSFFADRLKQYLRDRGQRHDLIDAVFALGEDDLVLIVKRVEALEAFLKTEDGANLLAGYRRAANILKAEEKKGDLPENLVVDGALIDAGADSEISLHQALGQVRHAIEEPLKKEDFAAVMTELAKLRAPVDYFFERVMVNDQDKAIRANRLALLADIRKTLHRVADFSLIEG
ncbi:MAG: glycine--tRNA ligase subunit beta [Hyphomonas sp.]|uniref:glycine--tRNA ligase subunit beta n=1 Tax=Hyphomonas sp. TaxID=87 RepID=UPI0035275677